MQYAVFGLLAAVMTFFMGIIAAIMGKFLLSAAFLLSACIHFLSANKFIDESIKTD